MSEKESKSGQNHWGLMLIVYLVWIIVVLGGEMLALGFQPTGLDSLVKNQIVPALVVAPLLLLAVVAYLKWWREVGFKGLDKTRDLILAWLPVLVILVLLVNGFAFTTLSSQVILIVLINSLLVGISEELMFRGLLLHSGTLRFGVWRAAWITTLLFALVHVFNGILTGDFTSALMQAGLVFLTGFMFAALRIRQNSIIPVMIIHGLWDFAIFISPQNLIILLARVMPLVFFLYGLWLLRGYRHRQPTEAES